MSQENRTLAIMLLVAVAALLFTVCDGASSKMDYLPYANVRTDPIVNRGALSDHVHTFYGAEINPRPSITHSDLRNTCSTSGNVEENKSLYWHPTVYKVAPDGTKTMANIYFATAYYIWQTGSGTTQTFQDGFQMIADQIGTDGVEDPKSRVVFDCNGESACERTDSCAGASFQTATAIANKKTFPTNQCSELEIKLVFPMCSDGRLDSPNHRDHMAYDDRSTCDDPDPFVSAVNSPSLCGTCPSSHPNKLLEIQFYFRILDYAGGHYEFSDGKGTVHADYMSGWDSTRLQQVLDECPNDSTAANPTAWCERNTTAGADYNPNGLTFRDLPKQKGDPRIRCMLDQIQQSPGIDTSLITTEKINNVQTLPAGGGTGTLRASTGSSAGTCPTSMSVASDCNPADGATPATLTFCTTAGCNEVYGRTSGSGGSGSGGVSVGAAVGIACGAVVALGTVAVVAVQTGLVSFGGGSSLAAGKVAAEGVAVEGMTPGAQGV